MDEGEVRSHKPRGVRFFGLTIKMIAGTNIISVAVMLFMVNASHHESIVEEGIYSLWISLGGSTSLVILAAIFSVLRMPYAVRIWEYKHWAKRITLWFFGLSIAVLPVTYLIMHSISTPAPEAKTFLLVEVLILNALIFWYFMAAKIKSAFVK